MLKVRLKRIGRKQAPFYRLVIMENSTKRDGRPVDEIGWYNPITKNFDVNTHKANKWLKSGVKPTERACIILRKAGIIEIDRDDSI